jgi:serine/threonine-protein kinase
LPTPADDATVPGPPVPISTLKRRASTPAEGQFLPGAVIAARYRMIGLLGRGGMGEVYRADDLKLGQPVALKFLPPKVEHDAEWLERFLTEVRMSLRVTHPNVCRVFDIGDLDGRHFLSMEYVDGEDLASLLRRIGRLPEDKAVEIARQLCAGLAAAHDEGVLHRDLKPANIMIDGRGRAKITDFGLAGATAGISGRDARAGTPQYMAPEQASGGTLTERTDIYALGLVLYELFTGKRAFEIKDIADLDRLTTSTPTSPSSHVSGLNPLVERAILRCLDPDPARRPASASALAASLPGGDPLAMAVAAGDTPSPEMVAAAGSDAGLRRQIAVPLLAVALAGMVAVSLLAGRISLNAAAAPLKAPEVMIERAQETLRSVGFPAEFKDSGWGFEVNRAYLNRPVADRATDGFSRQANSALYLWYRESSVLLERMSFVEPYLLLALWSFDPRMSYSGDVMVRLNREGFLRDLTAVPEQRVASSPSATNWPVLFKAAGLDTAAFRPDAPQWTPFHYGDERVAWVPNTEREDHLVRVEAAGFHGRPVYFSLIYPWTVPTRDSGTWRSGAQQTADLVAVLFLSVVMVAAVVVARRNLRLDRADKRGAMRLAVGIMGLTWFAWLLDEHHVPSIWELYLVMLGSGWALFAGTVVSAFYLALEPYVRRNWPATIISWSRAIAGNVRDSLVARDALIGFAAGAVLQTVTLMSPFVTGAATGILPLFDPSPGPLMGLKHAVAVIAISCVFSVFIGLMNLLLLLGFRKLLRREWAAIAGSALLLATVSSLATPAPLLDLPFSLLAAAAGIILLARVGLVAMIANMLLASVLPAFPVTWPLTSWYSGIGLLGIALLGALAIAAFRIATTPTRALRRAEQ